MREGELEEMKLRNELEHALELLEEALQIHKMKGHTSVKDKQDRIDEWFERVCKHLRRMQK